MLDLFAQSGIGTAEIVRSVMAGGSAAVTGYFWFVKNRKEKPNLKIYQLGPYRPSLRRGNPETPGKRLGLTQLEPGGVLLANNSIRQTSVLRFDCYLKQGATEIKGDWGWSHDDKPPWNIGPETTIAVSPACFFDVPEDYEIQDDLEFRVEFITVSGKRFGQKLTLDAPTL